MSLRGGWNLSLIFGSIFKPPRGNLIKVGKRQEAKGEEITRFLAAPQ